MALSILIADDHPIFRDGVKSAVRTVFTDCEIDQAGTMDALDAALRRSVPNLLLIDIFFPGMDAEDGISELRRTHPFMGIMIISMLTKPGAIGRLFRAGADGFVSKTAPSGSLASALKELMSGNQPVYLPDSGEEETASLPKGNMVDSLPPRQAQVFHYVCLGMTNKDIAKELGLSHCTVRAHVSALFAKLGVSNRTELASYGVRFGVLAYSGSHKKYCRFIGPQKEQLANQAGLHENR